MGHMAWRPRSPGGHAMIVAILTHPLTYLFLGTLIIGLLLLRRPHPESMDARESRLRATVEQADILTVRALAIRARAAAEGRADDLLTEARRRAQ